ncbi:phosphoribosylglycinamide formyltransferase [Bacillus sp. FSL K6-3431]|uniref:phosphoribosylglycinamide formyltransferase n=1 Tax=Bacillus sp. FSL K6-3431 TaxID=2921500 RepID=UPI0030F6420F
MKKIAVFASGTGSNFQAIIDAVTANKLHVDVALLVCDRPNAEVVVKAELAEVPVFAFEPKQFTSKAAFEQEIIHQLEQNDVEFIVLAGYMRLVGPTLLTAFANKIINIHPSLLPAFAGKDAIGQAVQAGVKITGVTIHFVDEGMDTGPIIAQKAVELADEDELSDVTRKIHEIEHIFYPETLEKLLGKKVQ